MLYWAVILVGVIINTVISSWLPKFEGLILILHILGFFAVIFPLVILGPHASPSEVFGTFINGGNWPTNGLSFFIGLLGNVYAFFAANCAIHMAEEIQNASMVVPRAIVISIVLNGFMGFGIALALLIYMGDIDATLNTDTGSLVIEIFYQAVESTTGAALMIAIVITLALCATVGIIATASRQVWAFSRDRAVPGWEYLRRVESKSAVSIYAVTLTTIVSCLLALIILGSATAFNDIVSLSVVGLFNSYLMTTCPLFWRRFRGNIKRHPSLASSLTNVPGAELTWGPWRVPGIFGLITNGFAIIYLIIIFFFVMWPPTSSPTAATMNYSSLMFGSTMLIIVLHYFLHARKGYTGPVIEVGY